VRLLAGVGRHRERVAGWGTNLYDDTRPPAGLTDVAAIAAGRVYALALRGDGTVVGWGSNDYGEATARGTHRRRRGRRR
jgi:alpha-tubulin suppressor-like RCC1 family protein